MVAFVREWEGKEACLVNVVLTFSRGEKSLNLSELEASEIPVLKTSVFFPCAPGSMEIL